MATAEKLLLQIFETKNRIIEQVKQQTELYNRHLASKALLHGHTPPSWLFNSNNSSSQELSKEDLISELLPPVPRSRPPVRYSVAGSSQYSKPFTRESKEAADGFGLEPHPTNKDRPDAVEGPSTSTIVEDVRISNIYTDPDQSLARIQRSKSRQRAIEQRNSATSQAKSNPGNKHTPKASSGGNILFNLDCEQASRINNSNILPERCAISCAKQSTCYLRNENDTGACSNEIKLTSLDLEQVYSVNEPSRSAGPPSISSEGFRIKEKSETKNEKSGDGYNDHAGPVAISKRSGNSRSPEKTTPRYSEVKDKDSNILNEGRITTRDIVCSEGDGQSNEKGVIAHAESSASSKSSGKSYEDIASKKEERGIEEKRNSATSQAKSNSGIKRTPRASSSGNILFALDNEQAGDISNSNIQLEPCAISGAKLSTCYLRNENDTVLCSNEMKLTSLDLEQAYSVNEPSGSAAPLSTGSEGCRVKGKSETENEKSGDGYNDHAGPVAISKRSGNSHSLEKTTPRNSEVEDKESNILNKGRITSRDIVCSEGDGRSNEKGVIAHAESSASSKRSGKSYEDIASKKEERGIEEKRNSATSQPKSNSGIEHTPWASSSGNILFALDNEQAGDISNSHIQPEPCAISGAKLSTYYLSNENDIGACSKDIKLTSLDSELVHSVNELSGSAEPLSTAPEGCRIEGKSEIENENSGDGYNDHAGPIAISKRSGNSRSLERTTSTNSEVEDKESNIFNENSITSRDIVEIDGHIECSKGDCQSNERGLNAHAESNTSSKSSGRSCEDTSLKKEESGIKEKGSDAHVEKSSTCNKSAQHENHLSDFMEENYFSECVPGKDVGSLISNNDPEGFNNKKCSFAGLLKQTCCEKRSGSWIIPPNADQGVSGSRKSDLEDGQPQNNIDPNYSRLVSLNKASLPDENSYVQMMGAGTNEELRCDSVQQLDNNQLSLVTRELDRSVNKISEDSVLISQTSKDTSNIGSAGLSFVRFQGSAGEKPIYEDSLFQRAQGDHVMLFCSDMSDEIKQPRSVNKIEATEPGTEKLAETFHVSEEDECREKSLEKSCSPFPGAAAGVSTDSYMPNKAGDGAIQMTKSEPRRSWHHEVEERQNDEEHSPADEAVSTQSNASNTSDDVIIYHKQGCEFSPELLVEEEKCYSTKNDENIVNHSHNNSDASVHSKWTGEAVKSTSEGLFVSMSPSYLKKGYAINHEDEERSGIKSDAIEELPCSERISSESRLSPQEFDDQPKHSGQSLSDKDLEFMISNWKNLKETFIEEGHSERNFVVGEGGILSNSVQSPHVEELCATDADQSHPELESFFIDSQSEENTLGFQGDMSDFNNLELPTSTIARLSMLERLCKSASSYKPMSYISSTFKMDEAPDLFHSIPNGLLEHTDVAGLQFRDDVEECQVSSSTPSEVAGGLQGVSHTNSLPRSSAPIDFSLHGFSTPEGRYWEGYSSRSSSSGKRLSSKPEFECFTIQEDSCISEGNESADEDSDKLPQDDSLAMNCHVINGDKFQKDNDSLIEHCGAREPSTETHKKFRSILRSSHQKKGTGRDTQTPLASGKRTAKESLNDRYKKLKTPGNSSLRNERLDSTRKPHGSNIVSNVTSFIPLIQEKQAAAKACPGKREIKVKALEAAEAAKRLEEKRENERKSKKEALKKERARLMEQEKAKQIELTKKKKEDEQRRKDADMVLRKRLREEEERKEEKKRARTEETRQKQRDQEEKLHAKKVGNMDSKKKSNHELKLLQMKKPGGDYVKLDNESRSAAISSSHIQQASTCPTECIYSADLRDNKQENCTPDTVKTSYFVGDTIQEKSYDISPYQGSDDEDDDEFHNNKFIPSWASKNLVAESLFLRDVDASVVFPPERICSMDEVLLPRKLQQGQSMLRQQ